jgi:hypothetical protein
VSRRALPAGIAATLMIVASLALTAPKTVLVVTLAQIALTLLTTLASIHITRLLHDAVPSSVRAAVASGAGAMSWLLFIPIALTFGIVSAKQDVHAAGWILSALTGCAAVMLTCLAVSRHRNRPPELVDRPLEHTTVAA